MLKKNGLRIFAALFLSIVTLSTAYAQDGSESEATAFLTQLMRDTKNPVIAQFAQESLQRLQGEQSAQAAIQKIEIPRLAQSKNRLAVPVTLGNNVTANFLVDTGATYTVITPQLANQLGIQIPADAPRMSFQTANGMISSPVVTLNNVNLGGVRVNGVKAIVQDLGRSQQFSGLLGMNFFQNMDLTIKQDRLILSISQAKAS